MLFFFVYPGVVICRNVVIHDNVTIRNNSVIREEVTLEPNSTWEGVPARNVTEPLFSFVRVGEKMQAF